MPTRTREWHTGGRPVAYKLALIPTVTLLVGAFIAYIAPPASLSAYYDIFNTMYGKLEYTSA